MYKKIALLDIFPDYAEIVESTGLGSLAAVMQENGYSTLLRAYNYSKIDYASISAFIPDVIGLPVNYDTIEIIKEITSKLKCDYPGVLFFSGGYLPTNAPDEIFEALGDIDAIIRGEGEYTLLEMLEVLNSQKDLNQVKGLSYRDGTNIVHNGDRQLIENLDKLPFPDRSVRNQYSIPMIQVEGARGCPCRCSFCSLHAFWNCNYSQKAGDWRAKSPARVVDEIELAAKRYGIFRFRFLDSSFENPSFNKERMAEVAKEILKRDINISYFVNFRASVHKILDDDLMNLLIDSGLTGVFLGLESFAENDIKIFNKSASERDGYKALDFLQQYPIYLNIGMINFHPDSTLEGLKKNALMLQKYRLATRLLFIRELMVFKGTPIFDRLLSEGALHGSVIRIDSYDFKDERVEKIVLFFRQLRKKCKYIDILEGYSTSYPHLLNDLKNVFRKKTDHAADRAIDIFESRLNYILDTFGEVFSEFTLELIKIAENGWREEEAWRIREMYISDEYLGQVVSQLELNSLLLQRNMIKLNRDYSAFFYNNPVGKF